MEAFMIRTAYSARPTVTRTWPALWTRLPFGGWQVRFWTDADGLTLIDVARPEGTLACRLSSAPQAAPSIDAGWTYCAPSPGEDSQYWALAVGHVPAGLSHVVSFARPTPMALRGRMTLPPQAPSGFWVVDNGLWAAAATGCYTHARLTAQTTSLLHLLNPVTE
jgi:hypothetical protein